jgi:microcystin-dependent protein
MGEVKIIAWNYAPKGWAFCNGQQLLIAQNQALFSLLGTTYGGNGQTTFALPNLQGRAPVHSGNNVTMGQAAGEITHTLNISELPAHTHFALGNTGAPNQGNPGGNFWAGVAGSFSTSGPDGVMNQASVTAVGGSQPHQNMQPYLVLNFIIALQGVFPSRN